MTNIDQILLHMIKERNEECRNLEKLFRKLLMLM